MRIGGLVVLVVISLALPVYAGSVSLLPGGEFTQQVSNAYDVQTPQALPHQSNSSVSSSAGSSAGSYALDSARFDVALRQKGTQGFSGRATGELAFSVNAPMAFQFTDQFAAVGGTIWTGYIDLVEGTTGDVLYRRVRFNSGQPIPGVVPGGNTGTGNVGMPAGMLEPGRQYQFRYILQSAMAAPDGSVALPASGSSVFPVGGPTPPGGWTPRPGPFAGGELTASIGLTFTPDSVVVPLPPAALAGAVLLGALGCHRLLGIRRRRLA